MDWCDNGALVVPQAQARLILGDLIAVDGRLDGALVKLGTNDLTPTPATVIGDLVVATFGGYTSQAADWGSVYNRPDGGAAVSGGAPMWVTTNAVDETVYYWYLTDAAGTGLLGIRRLANPVHLGAVGLPVQVSAEYYIPGPVGAVVPVV